MERRGEERREIRPGLIHLLLTEHNGQTGEEGGGEESWPITSTAPPLAGRASPDPASAGRAGRAGRTIYCKTATRDNQIL